MSWEESGGTGEDEGTQRKGSLLISNVAHLGWGDCCRPVWLTVGSVPLNHS